jgi:2,4-dienoyl-CoA reductase (NADPH2)
MNSPILFTPLTLRGMTFRNRIAMSPMCQYSAMDGLASDWHLVHLGSRAVGGAGLVMVEATAVVPEGRISPGCLGLWDDAHVEPLSRIARFVQAQGAVAGIQLAHSGRKGSCHASWAGGAPLSAADGSWTVRAPSSLAFDDRSPVPSALEAAEIDAVVASFRSAALRAVAAGFGVIEIHAAHGYLLHEFLSPLTNRRTDHYGGSFEHRTRIVRRVACAVRSAVPAQMPLFVRISATDWVEGGWDVAQSVELARWLERDGADLIDTSSGGLLPDVEIPVTEGYQVSFAQAIREQTGIPTAAVGQIERPEHAEEILRGGSAELIFIGRALLRNPYWSLQAEEMLESMATWPAPYRSVARPSRLTVVRT